MDESGRPTSGAGEVRFSNEARPETIPVSVIVPTIGRVELLQQCLESLARCRPRPAEVVVVDGSKSDELASVVDSFVSIGARRIREDGKGTGRAVNVGVLAARHDCVLVTHDDCTVAEDWIDAGARLVAGRPDRMVTGSVFPLGDARNAPGLATAAEPQEYRRPPARILLAHNMGFSRGAFLKIGGFDERMVGVSEDDDLSFRWVSEGRAVRYSPELKVWHAAWRTHAEMRGVYRGYAIGDGMFYAKHLLAGEWRMLRYIANDFLSAIRAEIVAVALRERRWWDSRLETFRGLPVGLWRGVRTFGLRRFGRR